MRIRVAAGQILALAAAFAGQAQGADPLHSPECDAARAALERPPDPPVAVAPPVYVAPPVVTTCDSAGCWDSNGHRLNNLGPMLVGPRGACTVVAGTVQCP